MPHALAQAVEMATTVLAVAGMGYFMAALLAAFAFLGGRGPATAAFAPGVSILKSLKGLDPAMLDAFRSHCRQTYAGEYELLFGVSTDGDPAGRMPRAARDQRQSQHAGAARSPCPIRLPADQRFGYHGIAALLAANHGPVRPRARSAKTAPRGSGNRALPWPPAWVYVVAVRSVGYRHGFSAQRAARALDRGRPALRARVHAGRHPRSARGNR